jgi:hypothetical protein
MKFKNWLLINEGMINVSAKIYTQVINDYFEKLREYEAFGGIRASTKSYPLIDKKENLFNDTSFSFLIGYFKKVTLNVKYRKFEKVEQKAYPAYYEAQDFTSMQFFKGMEFKGTIVLDLKILDVKHKYDYITLIQHEITHFIQDLEKIHAYLKSLERQFIYYKKEQEKPENKGRFSYENELERIHRLLNFGNFPAEDPLEEKDMPLAGISPLQITKKTMKDKKINFNGVFKGKDNFRIDHEKRPIEFQTNLISVVGDFQRDYFEKILKGDLKEENGYEIPDDLYSFDSYGSNLGWKNKIINDDKILEFFNNRNNKKLFLKSILSIFEKTDFKILYNDVWKRYHILTKIKAHTDTTDTNELYKWYLSNIYKEFVNKDIDMDYLKLLHKQDRLSEVPLEQKKDLLIDTLESLKGKKEQKYYAHDIKFSNNHDPDLRNFKIDIKAGDQYWNAWNILNSFYGDLKK